MTKRILKIPRANGLWFWSLIALLFLVSHPSCANDPPTDAVKIFSLSKASRTIPPRVAELIQFYVGGDGEDEEAELSDPSKTFSVRAAKSYLSARKLGRGQFEHFETLLVDTMSEAEAVWLIYPNGRARRLAKAEGYYQHKFGEDDPIGPYKALMESGRKSYAVGFALVSPDGPRTRSLQDGIFLYNFAPNERIRLLLYHHVFERDEFEHRFIAWQEFQVDDNGELLVRLPRGKQQDDGHSESYEAIAIGESTGEAAYPGKRLFEALLTCEHLANQILAKRHEELPQEGRLTPHYTKHIKMLEGEWKRIRSELRDCASWGECNDRADDLFHKANPALNGLSIQEYSQMLDSEWRQIRATLSDCE